MSKVSIGLTNPKSPANVGAVLRAAGCYQAGQIFYSGSRYDYASKFHTDTKNVSQNIPLQQANCLLQAKPEGAKLVCVDLVEGAIPLPDFEHPEQAYYVFGPEDGTIEQTVIDAADAVVYVPTKGCMNLAASVNVLLYDRLAKDLNRNQGDALIRASRDTNNKVKVRDSIG
ncbi:RNA methyltransferase [Thalassotalea litorea]|uniref:RNA methyltransferase n=1 Tax=Thalassotalea litorea TaxID=2020715 RepID=UPI0037364EA7